MKILSVGREFENTLVQNCTFRSNLSFFDYDIVLIDMSDVLYEYYARPSNPEHMGLRNIDDSDSVALKNDIHRRQNEIKYMIDLGRTVVVNTCAPQKCFVDSGQREYSGTGRNMKTIRKVSEVDLMSAIPFSESTVLASGDNLECKSGEPFHSFWQQTQNYFFYTAYFPIVKNGTSFIFIKGTDRVVGWYYKKLGKGQLIFIPSYVDDRHFKTKKELRIAEGVLIESLVRLNNELNFCGENAELPAWSSDYLLPGENGLIDKLNIVEKELDTLLSIISQQKQLIANLQQYKLLITSSGKTLENLVGKLFEEIGFQVEGGIPGRDDLILTYGENIAVVEVKGVSKSAAEKHAAQLEKWINSYFLANEIMPKGFLVVNAFKDIALAQRNEEAFPAQMVKYSQSRNHCLISTLQLLGIYFDINANPVKKDEIISKLFSTIGIFDEYNDWSQFLCEKNEITAGLDK